MKNSLSRQRGNILVGLFGMSFVITMMAAWITHIIVCIKSASFLLLIAGAFIFPVGVIHGIGVWFGAF